MEQVKEKKDREKSNKKRLLRAAVSLTMVLVLSFTVFAWFTNEKKLDTITKINAPTTLKIGAGNKEDAARIDLGEIDVTASEYKEYVFCVYSDSVVGNYKLQLAHTTNIPFTYQIYKATDSEASGDVTYTDEKGTQHFYSKNGTDSISGSYLNLNSETNIANNTYHSQTYDSYNNVQKNAEPLYWQSDVIAKSAAGTSFTDYYILKLSWTNGEVSNNKETDMVYITASMTT